MPKTTQRRWHADGANAVPGGGVSLASGERAVSDYGAWRYVRKDRQRADKRRDLSELSQRTGREITRMPAVTRTRRADREGNPILTVAERIVARLEREENARISSAQVRPFVRADAPYRAFGVGQPRERV